MIQQLQLAIIEARRTMSPEAVVEHVIGLYAAEIEKANDEIFRLGRANDELFKLKQRAVIANRELMRKVESIRNLWSTHELSNEKLASILAGKEEFLIEEDFVYRYHNEARFHQFVEEMCEQTLELYKRRHG